MKFTTSWDDGYALDTRIADMLSAHGAKGTFYICPDKQHGKDMLSKKEIQALASNHELGAHTMGHPKLTRISEEQAKKESKKRILFAACCFPGAPRGPAAAQPRLRTGFIQPEHSRPSPTLIAAAGIG